MPPFDKIRAEHFMPAFERAACRYTTPRSSPSPRTTRRPTFENTILAYDNAGQMLAQTELIFGMPCAAETNERMQACRSR